MVAFAPSIRPRRSAREELGALADRVLRPAERPPLDVWADRHRVIAVGTSERPGPWSTDAAPYLRGIMRAIGDPAVRTVSVIKASQLGVTECLFNTLGYAADCDPGPMLFVYPSGRLAGDLAAERIHPSILACPRLVARLRARTESGAAGARNLRAQKITFDRMVVWLVGSNSQSELEARAVRWLLLDEIDSDEYGPRALELARERTKAYTSHKIVQVSKPSLAGRGIDAQYARSDQRRFEMPCPLPGCGRFFEPRFAHLRWEGPGATPAERAARRLEADPAAVERSAWIACPHCRGRIESHRKPAMLARGLWVPRHQFVTPDGAVHDRPDAPPPADAGHAGFRLSSLHSPWLPWGYVARRYIEAGGATREWVNGDLGEPWQPQGDKAEIEELRAAIKAAAATPRAYRLCAHDAAEGRAVPDGVCVLVGGIDLQHDRAYVEVRGFSQRGLDSYLLYHDTVDCPIEDPLALHRLDEIVSGRRPRFIHADGLPIPVSAWAIDSGEGRRTREVYAWVLTHPHVYAAKGASSAESGYAAMPGPFELKLLPVESAGLHDPARPLRSGEKARAERHLARVRFLLVNTGYYKDAVLARIKQAVAAARRNASPITHPSPAIPAPPGADQHPGGAAGEGAAGEGAAGGGAAGGGMHWPTDTHDEYLRQVTAEHLVRVLVKSGINAGRHRLVWAMRPGRADNHFLDTCVLTLALGDALRVRAVTRERFEASRNWLRAAAAPGAATVPPAAAPHAPHAPPASPAHHAPRAHAAAGPRVVSRTPPAVSGWDGAI